MEAAEFDSYVETYEAQHRQSIRLSGEAPEYFADYKIKELSRLASGWNLTQPRLLDFGGGMGNSLPAFRTYFPDTLIAMADVSAESLKASRRIHGGSEPQLLIADGKLPSPDGVFDLIFTACVFHHIDHAEHIHWLRELRRVARPGGRLVIFEHNPANPLTRHAVRNCPFDANAHLITAPQMRERLALAGWENPFCNYHIFFPAALARLRPIEAALRWCRIGAQYACIGQAPR